MNRQLWGTRLTDLCHYEMKGEKALRMVFEGENEEGCQDNVTVFMTGHKIKLLKKKLGPRNITRFAPACVDCTVAQAKHFNFCPWCGEALK